MVGINHVDWANDKPGLLLDFIQRSERSPRSSERGSYSWPTMEETDRAMPVIGKKR